MSNAHEVHGFEHAEQRLSDIERELRSMSALSSGQTGLWSSALAASRREQKEFKTLLHTPISLNVWTVVAAACLGLVIVGVMLPSLGRARSSSPAMAMDKSDVLESLPSPSPAPVPSASVAVTSADKRVGSVGQVRLVARKAAMDIGVPDVRAAYGRVQFGLSEAGGEYIETSSISGEGESARASLTLRVLSKRLSAVMDELRSLGIIAQESVRGEDVTDQVVDLEARLRNEQRVETEMLELLSSRKSAPLADVLAVRSQLDEVRGRIERLTAQRDRLGNLVALSMLQVELRHESTLANSKHPPKDYGTWSKFGDMLSAAWQQGASTLMASIAWIVRVAVGGLVWWIVLALGIIAAMWLRRRALRVRASEPAPRL